MKTFTEVQTFVVEHCFKCGIAFGLPKDFNHQCHAEGENKVWYCPNGHGQVYSKSDAQKLKEQLATAKRDAENEKVRANRWQSEAQHFEKSRNAYKGQVTKIKRRVANGVCPCCNRTFQDLARHMANKHPGFESEETKE